MIKIRQLIKSYRDRLVINGLDLSVEAGEKIAIIGPSGCGKSTLLRLIMGLHEPDNGVITVAGVTLSAISHTEHRLVRRHIGMLFQSAALFDSLSVFDNIAFPLESTDDSDRVIRDRVLELLHLVGMTGYERAYPHELSGGQRKRVGLARALALKPKIMLYDEPTTGLDPVLSTSIEDLIVDLNRQFAVTSIVVTHQVSTIFRTADRIYLMKDGQLLPAVAPSEIDQNEAYRVFVRGGLA